MKHAIVVIALAITLLPGRSGLTAAPQSAPPQSASAPDRYRFGVVSLYDAPSVERVFTLRNTTGVPLTIARIDADCGCTSAVVTGGSGAAGALPRTLKPGETAGVRVVVDLTVLPPGEIRKSVSVLAAGRSEPVAVFEIAGTLRPAVRFDPATLELGGRERSRTLAVSLDPRLAPDGKWPPLVSSDPAVRLVPLPDAGGAKTGLPTRAWRVEIAPDAPLGYFSGTIGFSPPKDDPRAAVALASGQVRFAGSVEGDIRAEPVQVFFGAASAGPESRQRVRLVGRTPAALSDVKVACDSAHVAASLGERTGSAGQPARMLLVTLKPSAPAGPFQATVTVTLPGGQRLLIPVRGYVLPPKKNP